MRGGRPWNSSRRAGAIWGAVRTLKGWALVLAVATAVVAGADLAGILALGDARLESLYYPSFGQRSAAHKVVLVAVDAATLEAWGGPGRAASQLAIVRTKLAVDRPALVVDTACALASPPCSSDRAVAAAGGSGVLELSERELARCFLRGPLGIVRSVTLGAGDQPSAFARIASRANLELRQGASATLRLAPRRDDQPAVSAVAVASGSVPAGTFSGRIVVLGITAPGATGTVETTVGPLTVADVLAQTLDQLSQSRLPTPFGPIATASLCALAALAVLLLRRDRSLAWRVFAQLGVAMLVVVVDVVLFVRGIARPGATGGLIAVAVGSALGFATERREAARRLSALLRLMAQRSGTGQVDRSQAHGDDAVFWHRLAALGRVYLQASSSMIAELSPGEFQYEIRALDHMDEGAITDRRRDVRREPYRAVFLAHEMVSSSSFLKPELQLRSWIVPLIVLGEVRGFWLLNFSRSEFNMEGSVREIVSVLAAQLANAIEMRRLQRGKEGLTPTLERLVGQDRVLESIDVLGAEIGDVETHRDGLMRLVNDLPIGVLVATLWHDVEFVNDAMTAALRLEKIRLDTHRNLIDILVSLTSRPRSAIESLLRDAIFQERGQIDVTRLPGTGPSTANEFAIARLSAGKTDGSSKGARPESFVRFVLVAKPRAGSTQEARVSSPHAPAFDIGPVVEAAVQATEAIVPEAERRPVVCKIPESLPGCRGTAHATQAAVEAILLESARYGRVGAPIILSVDLDGDEVVVLVLDSTYAIPAAVLPSVLLRTTGPQGPGARINLAAARDLLQSLGAQLSVESMVGAGTKFEIRLPVARASRESQSAMADQGVG